MKNIQTQVIHTIKKYNLVDEGDVIAVGLSGGKDSLVLLKVLNDIKRFYVPHFDIIAITIDNYSGKQSYDKLISFCAENEIKYHIEKTDIADIIFNIRKESNPCSLCAKLRRGILCTTAKKLGANKLALAHHLDDMLDTFVMSALYEGRLNTIKPKSYMSNTDITVIRPLFLTREKDVINYAKDLPVQKSICPVDKVTSRQKAKDLLSALDNRLPNASDKLANAIVASERYNLLDK